MHSPLYLASSNSNKVREFRDLLQIPLETIKIELEELQTTDLQILLQHKLQQAYEKIQAPVIVEDTSLYFNAWNRLPGPLIKWFLQEMGVKQLVEALSSFEDKTARAVSSIGYTDGGERYYYFEGAIEGRIVMPRGDLGFGWDSIFQPEGSSLTFSEMRFEEKNQHSMRYKALQQFRKFLSRISSY